MTATLLDLPPVLRMWIYAYVTADHDIYLSEGNEEVGVVRNTSALAQVCGIIRHEVLPILRALTDLTFHLMYSSEYYLDEWLDAMGPERILQVRKVMITGPSICHLADDMGDLQ